MKRILLPAGVLLTLASAVAAPELLSPKGTASASSEFLEFSPPGGAGNAIDGNRNGDYYAGSVFHTQYPEPNPPSFFEVDLGAVCYLDHVAIWPRVDAVQGTVRNFRLSVFDAAGAAVWEQVFLAEDQADNAWATSALRGARGQRVRLTRLDQVNEPWLTFAEFEVWGSATPLAPNLALNKVVTSSPAGAAETPATAGNDGVIDGDYGHVGHPVFLTQAAAPGQFWQVDLGAEVPVDYVLIFNRTDAAGTGPVKLSIRDASGAEVFATIVDVSRETIVRGGRQYDVLVDPPGAVIGRFVRIETTAAEALAFAELEVFGPPPDLAPYVVSVEPRAGEVLHELTSVEVVFSEPVFGMDAADLLVKGNPATAVTRIAPGTFRFGFPQPADGPVAITWAEGHGIVDALGKPFVGTAFNYTVDTAVPLAQPVITEFLANNAGGLKDEDGDTPDWIEIYNPGPGDARLGGWFLTDSPARLTKWRIPALTLPVNERLLVFASGKDRTNALGRLHTSFALAASGGYVALVRPDGVTVASAFQYGSQRPNVSFGAGRTLAVNPLLSAGAAARFLVPSPASSVTGWNGSAEFDDSSWTAAKTGVGFDQSESSAGMIAFWDFDDAADPAVVLDRSGGKHHGSLSGVAFTADGGGRTGKPGDRGLNCTGAGGMTVVDATKGMFDTAVKHDAITISLWVNGGAQQPSTDSVFWAGSQTDGGGSRSLNAHLPWSDSVIYWDTGCCDPSLNRVYVGVTDSTKWKGRWNHYAFVKRGDSKQIFLNGGLLLDGVNTENMTPIRSFFLGSGAGGSYTYHGRIDDVAIWDVALDKAQIAALAAGASPFEIRRLGPLIATDVGAVMRGVNSSALLRIPFTVDDPKSNDVLVLRMRYDDGFVAWVNGVEVARRNALDALALDSASVTNRPSGAALLADEIEIQGAGTLLHAGRNVLAIHALNSTRDDGDFLVLPELLAGRTLNGRFFTEPTPGTPNNTGVSGFVGDTHFEPDRGFYSEPIDVHVWTDTPGATLVYTTDGSLPSPSNGTPVIGSSTLVPVSTTTVLRAAAFHDDYAPSDVDTQTYLFALSVASQKRPASVGPTWPGGAPTDFAIDARVVNGAKPGYSFSNALTSIPVISIVMPEPDIFGPGGIYANSGNRGSQWEREASVEWMYPDGRPGFHHNAGVQIHGNISRDKGFTPKHSFSVLFRGSYGSSRLDFPIYPDTPARGFKRLVLRGGSTDTWPCVEWDTIIDGVRRWYRKDSSYIRDQWVRDAQIAMGQPSGHGTFAQLFLNGIYWGLYNVCERPDDDFAALHVGGDKNEYDVLADFAEVHAGDATAWNQLMSLAGAGLSGNANYQRLMGNKPDGTRNPSFPVLLDVTNLVDYMILSVFIGSDDWPNHNWWASRRRGDLSTGFKFFTWDQEISINSLVRQHSSWGPIYAEADAGNTPTYVYARCRANLEFRTLFADRVQKHLFSSGALSVSNNLARWAARSDEIDHAVVAESARWGDYQRPNQPYLREKEWLTNDLWMRNTFFRLNHNIALKRFRDANLYPKLNAPTLSQPGGIVPSDFALTLTNPNATGTLYFTTDGSDPRLVGGTVSSSALIYSGPVPIAARTSLRVRIKDGANWSALVEAEFYTSQDFAALQPTEIYFNPSRSNDQAGEEFEFLELQNTGASTLDLSGLQFSAGVNFTFAEGTTLGPGAFVVLARNPAAFASRFSNALWHGVYDGRLNNAGETVTLTHPTGFNVFSFAYGAALPWPPAAAGLGYSLQRANFLLPPGDPAAWVAAPPTPGAALDPSLADSDGDGLPDVWEKASGTDPLVADSFADPDNDGFTNLEEFLAGTDPRDPGSALRFEVTSFDHTTGEVQLGFTAAAGHTYAIQWRSDAATGEWTIIARVEAQAEARAVTVPDLPPGSLGFYRLVTPAR